MVFRSPLAAATNAAEKTMKSLSLAFVLALAVTACQSSNAARIDCHQDSDCPSPTICQVCNGRCVYEPNAACDLVAPCPCGYACRSQRCQADLGVAAATCTFDRDCPVDQFCNRAQFQCQFPMELAPSSGTSCRSNAQCSDGEICSSAGSANECAENLTRTCHTATECPAGYDCGADGQCVHHSC